MTGKVHMLSGCLVYSSYTMVTGQALAIENVAVAAIAAIIADVDEPGAMFNRLNPVTGSLYVGERLAVMAMNGFFLVGLACLFWTNRAYVMHQPAEILAGALVAVGLVMACATSWIRHWLRVLVRFSVRGLNLGAGIALLYFSEGNPGMILPGVFLILAGLCRHRTILHSPEAVVLLTLGAYTLFSQIGRPELAIPVLVGYCTHLYLGDILTDDGVPLSAIPYLLKTVNRVLPVIEPLIRSRFVRLLDRKLRIPLFVTRPVV